MPPLPHSVNAASPIPPCPADQSPESGAHPSFEPFSNFREKMPVRPRNGTKPPRSSGHFWAQLAISAISAPNWQLFLAISTLNWHLLQEIQKKMEDKALSNTGKARDAGGKPWEFGKTREAVGLKQHKKATAEEIPCKSVSCWKHFGAMLDKRWEVARARGFGRFFYARSPQQAR